MCKYCDFEKRNAILERWEQSDKEHTHRTGWDGKLELDEEGKANAERFRQELLDMALPTVGGAKAFLFFADGYNVTCFGGYAAKREWVPRMNYCPMCGRKLTD